MQHDTKVEIKFSKSKVKSTVRAETLTLHCKKYIAKEQFFSYKLMVTQQNKYISWEKKIYKIVRFKISEIQFLTFLKLILSKNINNSASILLVYFSFLC